MKRSIDHRLAPPHTELGTSAWQARWAAQDLRCARLLHRATSVPQMAWLLRGLSRASDGVGWYLLMLLLPWLGGARGTDCLLRMLLVAALNLALYRLVKRGFARPRPFAACADVQPRARVLDEFSFPSGHTLHAVGFAVVLGTCFPALAWGSAALAALIGVSRVVLGLHYPSDVVAGAAIGALTAHAVLALW